MSSAERTGDLLVMICPIKRSNQNRKLQPRSLDNLKQLLHLLCVKKGRLKRVLPRPIHLHGNILRYHVGFHRILQGLINYRMVVDNRIRRDGFQLLRIHADGRMTFKFQGGKTLTSY